MDMFNPQEALMKAKVRAIPKGYHVVTPYLSVKGAASAIAFYKRAFGATELCACRAPVEPSAMPKSKSPIPISCSPTNTRI